MVRLHALSLFRDRPLARVLWAGRGLADHDLGRICRRLSHAAAGSDLLRPYRRSLWPADFAVDVRCADDRGNACTRPHSDARADRPRGWNDAPPLALRDGV